MLTEAQHPATAGSAAHDYQLEKLPKELKLALTEESHVRVCRTLLAERVITLQAELRKMEAKESVPQRIMALLNRPRALSVQIAEARARHERMRRSLASLEALEKAVATAADDKFENYIRETDESYIRGLAALRYVEDWKRALDRFERRLRDFIRAIGQARNGVVAGYSRETKRISPFAEELMTHARNAGHDLDSEVCFANELADMHEEFIAATPMAGTTLPRITSYEYAHWTDSLAGLDIGEMQLEFSRILKLVETLDQTGVTALREAVMRSIEAHRGKAKSFVAERLSRARKYAEVFWFDPEQAPQTVARLEQEILHRSEVSLDFEIKR